METAIVSIICIALIVFGGMTMSQGFLTSVDSTAQALDKMGQRNERILRTELSPTYVDTQNLGSVLNVFLSNTGQAKLADFGKWDVIIQYYDGIGVYHVVWLPYTEAPLADNQWRNNGIYWSGNAEVFERGIVNPGEEIRIQARLNPPIGPDTNNQVIVSTPNGVPALISFHQN
jgi:hypothetical protein